MEYVRISHTRYIYDEIEEHEKQHLSYFKQYVENGCVHDKYLSYMKNEEDKIAKLKTILEFEQIPSADDVLAAKAKLEENPEEEVEEVETETEDLLVMVEEITPAKQPPKLLRKMGVRTR